MNRYGRPQRKTIIWLGSDDGDPDGMNGYGYNVTREDNTVSVEYDRPQDENGEELQVFILPDLFPAIRRIMDTIEKQRSVTHRKLVPWQSSQPSSSLRSSPRLRLRATARGESC